MVGEMEARLPTLVRPQVDPLIAINLLRYCVNSKPSYLARVLQEPQMSIQALEKFDMAVDLALCRTAEHVPRNSALPANRRRTIHSSSVIRCIMRGSASSVSSRPSYMPVEHLDTQISRIHNLDI